MRPIDADAMRQDWLENGQNEYVYDTNAVLDSIDTQPTIDVKPVRHGRWVYVGQGRWECSECKRPWPVPLAKAPTANYCPNCGAKMDLPN